MPTLAVAKVGIVLPKKKNNALPETYLLGLTIPSREELWSKHF